MTFDKAEQIESLCFQMRQADYPRGRNRSLINSLFNGFPPYSSEEEEENGIEVNVNFLESTRLGHDARTQYYQSLLKPGNFFNARTDSGPPHKRATYNTVVTKELTKIMKRSTNYIETLRSKFAMLVLHGIAPAGWKNQDFWCPDAFGIEDVYVPGRTLLTMQNMPFFPVYRSFTAPELIKLTRGPVADPGWNKELVEECLAWLDKESTTLSSANWPEVWSAEKMGERIKGDGGWYMGDDVPTINAYDFYFWNDDDKVQGWNRRIILDGWSTPAMDGGRTRLSGKPWDSGKTKFLYNPGTRKFASQRSEIINWQFADLSSVAPFRYHSVRSLGFLLYAVCDLQNRMRCKFSEAVFEQLMVYFRVSNADDMQRALKVDLVNRGFIDDSVEFIKAQDRYQVNANLVAMGLNENANLISKNSQSNTPGRDEAGRGGEKPTATQWMGEESKVTQLISAGLNQAYMYQMPEYREIFRRFTKKHSKDPDVRTFQANCLRQRVPEAILYNPECWDLESDRVLGAGNKSLEMAISQQLMQYRNLYDPEPQRQILRDVTLALTDDAARAEALVPEQPVHVTDAVHDAQLAAGTLMQGLPVALKTGMNHIEYADTLLATLASVIQKAMQTEMATPEQVTGMQMMAQNIAQHVGIIAQDKNEQQRVKQYGDQLGKLMNLVKAFAQRNEEQQKQNGDQPDPETSAKIKATMLMAQAKSENTKTAHAQRTAQRQVQFELDEKRKQQEFEAEMTRESGDAQVAHDMKLATTETAHGLKLDEHRAQLEALKSEHDRKLAEAESRHKRELAERDMQLRKQQSDHKMALQTKESAHKRKLATKMAKAQADQPKKV